VACASLIGLSICFTQPAALGTTSIAKRNTKILAASSRTQHACTECAADSVAIFAFDWVYKVVRNMQTAVYQRRITSTWHLLERRIQILGQIIGCAQLLCKLRFGPFALHDEPKGS